MIADQTLWRAFYTLISSLTYRIARNANITNVILALNTLCLRTRIAELTELCPSIKKILQGTLSTAVRISTDSTLWLTALKLWWTTVAYVWVRTLETILSVAALGSGSDY